MRTFWYNCFNLGYSDLASSANYKLLRWSIWSRKFRINWKFVFAYYESICFRIYTISSAFFNYMIERLCSPQTQSLKMTHICYLAWLLLTRSAITWYHPYPNSLSFKQCTNTSINCTRIFWIYLWVEACFFSSILAWILSMMVINYLATLCFYYSGCFLLKSCSNKVPISFTCVGLAFSFAIILSKVEDINYWYMKLIILILKW